MRKFRVEIDGKPFLDSKNNRQLRVTFTSRMQYTTNLAFLDLAIYNLSKNTKIEQGKKIILSAGYENEFDRIFTGKIITVLQEKDGADTLTRLLCRSSYFDDRHSIQATVGVGGSLFDAFALLESAWGIPIDYDKEQFKDDKNLTFARGYALNGDVVKNMQSLASQFDFSWVETYDSIIVDKNKVNVKSKPREVSMFTGMIGFPEAESDVGLHFVNVTMRLSPRVRMRTMIDLKSEYATYSTGNFYIQPPKYGGNLDGLYKVVEVYHRGDNFGKRWITEFKGQR